MRQTNARHPGRQSERARRADGREQSFVASSLGAAQQSLDLAPHFFDGIEIGTVGRQEANLGSGFLDKGPAPCWHWTTIDLRTT